MADYLLDITQNGVEAGATRVQLHIVEDHDTTRFTVIDNGCGMSEEIQARAVDPFYTDPAKHSARKAGFGLPFLIHGMELCEGDFSLSSLVGVGTTVAVSFPSGHIDAPPMGDLTGTLLLLLSMSGEYELEIRRSKNRNEWELCRSDLLTALGDLSSPASLKLAGEYIKSQEENIS